MEGDHDNHHLTSLDIENNDGDETTGSSLMQTIPSGDDAVRRPLDEGESQSQPRHHAGRIPSDPPQPQPQRVPSSASSKDSTNLPLLTACYLGALTTGATTYAFSFYSNALKSSLHLSQNQLDTLSSATFCAGVLSWMPGMAVDAWGARASMIVGGTSNAVNLTLYWLIATRTWNVPSRAMLMFLLSSLGVFVFVGCALVTGSVFKAIVEGCGPGTKGKAVGCAKGYVGVGSGVYVCLFGALFGGGGGGEGAGAPAATAARAALSFVRRRITGTGTTATSSGGSAYLDLWQADVPRDPELRSLDFLLMAAALSFLAGTLPALCLFPKRRRSSPGGSAASTCRDGTRPVHFHVIYAGLSLLGIWLVGTSLMELHEEEEQRKMDGNAPAAPADSYAPNVVGVAMRALSSSSSPERHWGSAFFILLLWWGPALSLLVIPARKSEERLDELTDELVMFAPEDDDGGSSSFEYDDDAGINENVGGNNNEQEEEETFLQDDAGNLPSSRVAPFALKNGTIGAGDRSDADVERNYTLLQMLRTWPAWLMAWTCVILVGGGTVMTNNIGQMTEALGFSPDLTPASLAFFSAAQGASRVMTGIASELALKWNLPWFCGCSGGGGVPRPAFLVVASLVSAASHFVLAVSTSEEGFAFGVTLSGVAFGMVWPMMVLITGEVFGTRHVGANYMFFDGFSSAAGTLLLSKFVAQIVYDEHIVEHHGDLGGASPAATDDEGSDFKCFGPGCFRASHIIISLLSLTCIVSSVGLMRTTRHVYQIRRH